MSANKLREQRELRLWTQAELAKQSGVCLRALLDIESGKRKPRITTVRKLMTALGIEFSRWREVFPK